MNRSAVPIPEKLFFKIGEVCDLTGVQAHVLRYWESEFPMLAPQKNRAGQRTYRKRDVEMVLRIKDLLYEDQYTIAGAKKKLSSELRGASKLKVVTSDMTAAVLQVPAADAPVASTQPPTNTSPVAHEAFAGREVGSVPSFGASFIANEDNNAPAKPTLHDSNRRDQIQHLAAELRSLLKLLKDNDAGGKHQGLAP